MARLPWFPSALLTVLVRVVAAGDDASTTPVDSEKPIVLAKGPHLLLDDHLIARSTGVTRVVVPPQRFLDAPVVTGSLDHQNWQPFFTVLHDPAAPAAKRFRMWYNVDVVDDPRDGQWFGKTGYLESADGIHWPGPYQRLNSLTEDGRVRFGASVVDDGPDAPVPDERYKMLYCDVGQYVGPRVAFSRDGLQWTVHNGGLPILPKTPSDDIWSAGYDPLRKRYFLIGKHFGPCTWTNAEGEALTVPIRRYFASFSPDFKTWSDPEGLVYSPDERDSGITQWYGAGGFQVRGDLIVGFLRVLRDDLSPAGVPEEALQANNTGSASLGANLLGKRGGSGMGYTVLTWTRDGVKWERDRHTDPFFEPDPQIGAWDHAMAWIGSSVEVDDGLYLYYAGYRWGHKYHHSVDRQIGLVKVPRDRFVARQADAQAGSIVTPVVVLGGDALSLNVAADGGEVRVQISDASGEPIPGFGYADCRPVTSDSIETTIEWSGRLSSLRDRPVRLELSLRNARLFAIVVD